MQLHNRWVTLGIVLFTSDVNVQAKRMLCRMLRDRGFQLYPDSNLSIFLQHSQSVPIKPITILAHDKTDFKKISVRLRRISQPDLIHYIIFLS